jgi:hypothetical protein
MRYHTRLGALGPQHPRFPPSSSPLRPMISIPVPKLRRRAIVVSACPCHQGSRPVPLTLCNPPNLLLLHHHQGVRSQRCSLRLETVGFGLGGGVTGFLCGRDYEKTGVSKVMIRKLYWGGGAEDGRGEVGGKGGSGQPAEEEVQESSLFFLA